MKIMKMMMAKRFIFCSCVDGKEGRKERRKERRKETKGWKDGKKGRKDGIRRRKKER